MGISKLDLYITSFSHVEPWLTDEKRTHAEMRRLLDDKSLSPIQRYELGSFIYCMSLHGVFNRLRKIRQIASHSLYPKKGEDKTELKKDWIIYNYHNYMTIFQSVLEVAIQLTNEVLDLGIPMKNCKFHTVSNNRRVKAAGIKPIVEKLSQITKKHREGKNLLLHYGKGTSPPVRTGHVTSFNVSDMARQLGLEGKMLSALGEFLTIKDQEALVKLMDKECSEIESQIGRLFNKLLYQYNRIHTFYVLAAQE